MFDYVPPHRRQPWLRPTQVLVLSFLLVIGAGTLLLASPWASSAAPLGMVDALFTATSATCVTGLAVADTGTRLSGFGQGVVLALMQLGGLGIMTYSSLVLLALGERVSFQGEALLRDTLGQAGCHPPSRLVRDVFLVTLGCEAVGAALLYGRFATRMEPVAAAYHAIFHSVSAFCNAGFSLYADGFVAYRDDWAVNWVLMVLIVSGGLGFVVLRDVAAAALRVLRRQRARLRLHTKVVLYWSGALVALGTASILVFEAHNALAGLPWGERLLAALFQSVTARTAGFNTLDYGALTDVTLFLTVGLMFVGASPGSCGGGIKTTSAAVVMALFASRIRGLSRVTLHRRTVPDAAVNRAVSIVVAGFVLTSVAAFLLVMVELSPQPHRGETAVFLDILFETVSAFGTVGLSTGMTAGFSPLGKLILIALMFVGRLGPLTLALAIGRSRVPGSLAYAEEDLMVG